MSIPQVASSQLPRPDTQAVLLLCGRFGRSRDGVTPLSDAEYNHVAVWLHRQGLSPGGFARRGRTAEGARRRPASACVSVSANSWSGESRWLWQWKVGPDKGLWVLSRSDDGYPQRLKGRGKRSQAPPVLYGAGDPVLLSGGGLAIVGSREASEEALDLARSVAARLRRAGNSSGLRRSAWSRQRGYDRSSGIRRERPSACSPTTSPEQLLEASIVVPYRMARWR